MSKAFEKVIVRYIINRTAGIWRTNKQHGFLPGKCTMDAVIKVMFDIGKAIDSKLSVISIFFDFAKAFDLVPHDLLLAKLDSLTLPDSPEKLMPRWLIKWIAAYLTDRQQRVRVNNIETAWTPVTAVVIQGSVLGPILFLLYIADINYYMPADVEFENYADDIINYIIGRATSTTLPQEAIDGIHRWCLANGMRLNASKCKVLHFPATRNKPPPKLLLEGNVLEVVNSYKYLGVELNSQLDSSQQWTRVYSLINSVPFLIKQLKRSGLEEKILVSIYKSLVLSHFNYSATALVAASEIAKHEMQVFQNRIIGLTKELARSKYGITDITSLLDEASLNQVRKLLQSADSPLAAVLATTASRRANSVFAYDIPRAKTSKFNTCAVLRTLRLMRDSATSRRITVPVRSRCPVFSYPIKHYNMHKRH
jgi:hypothetical protein